MKRSKMRAWIASPWVSAHLLFRHCSANDRRLVVRLSSRNDIRISDFDALKKLDEAGKWQVRCHEDLHAKLYLFDDFVIIGSSNLTDKGMGISGKSNAEASIRLQSPEELNQIASRFQEIWDQSTAINDFEFSMQKKRPKIRGPLEILELFKPHNPFERIL